MRRQAEQIHSKPFDINGDYYENVNGIHRIIDQSEFEFGNQGGCQVATVIAAIEYKYNKSIDYKTMEKFLLSAKRFYGGNCAKISKIIKFLMVRGYDFGFGKVFACDYESIGKEETSYESVLKATRSFDLVGLGYAMRSNFFSEHTGKIVEYTKLKYGHANRAVFLKNTQQLVSQNSYGPFWAKEGVGYITKEKFDLLSFWEIKCCNFKIVK